jgi:uncharacterized protein YggT (Ycf19 family)
MPDVWTYWYFHVPNFILAALVYTLIGRFALSFFVPEDWDNYIWRAFKRLTDPAVDFVALGTPRLVPHRVVLLFSALWLMVARVALAIGMASAGLLPMGPPA